MFYLEETVFALPMYITPYANNLSERRLSWKFSVLTPALVVCSHHKTVAKAVLSAEQMFKVTAKDIITTANK